MSEKIYLMEKSVYDPNNKAKDMFSVATTSTDGLMSSTDKSKLNGVASGANNYVLPVATSSNLGGVKSGTDITVDSSGNVSVNDDSHNHIISNINGLQDELNGKLDVSGGTMTGALVAQSNTSYTTAQVRNATMSTSAPSGGSNGQVHYQYS